MFKGAGIIQGQHNLDDSIESFAHSCFKYALDTKQDLALITTIQNPEALSSEGFIRAIRENLEQKKGGNLW